MYLDHGENDVIDWANFFGEERDSELNSDLFIKFARQDSSLDFPTQHRFIIENQGMNLKIKMNRF